MTLQGSFQWDGEGSSQVVVGWEWVRKQNGGGDPLSRSQAVKGKRSVGYREE